VEPGTKIAVISKSGEGVPQAAPPSQEKTASQPPPAAEKESIGKGTTKTETSSLKGKEKTLFTPQPAARAPSSPPKPSEPQLPPKERERIVSFMMVYSFLCENA
jgi:2-oxoglutarate dehydrogenase E2 component (dihydrolipoamide succinyltransferase)